MQRSKLTQSSTKRDLKPHKENKVIFEMETN